MPPPKQITKLFVLPPPEQVETRFREYKRGKDLVIVEGATVNLGVYGVKFRGYCAIWRLGS